MQNVKPKKVLQQSMSGLEKKVDHKHLSNDTWCFKMDFFGRSFYETTYVIV